MKDRVRIDGGNGRSSKLMCPTDYNPASFSAFIQDLKDGVVYVDVTANNSTGADAGVSEVGTALNKANLLSDATATKLGYDVSDNPTPNDAIDTLCDKLDEFVSSTNVTLLAADWTSATNTSGDTYYYQTISVTGMTTAKQNTIGINLANPATADSKTARDNAVAGFNDWVYDGWYECATGAITFKTYVQPTNNFAIVIVGG